MFKKETIRKFINTPTPFYYYDLELLQETLNALKKESDKYFFHVHYALKANANDEILALIRQAGLGADCVSGNEIKKAANHAFDKVFFAGVGKNDEEINVALEKNITCFNCESLEEIEVIDQLANRKNKTAPIAFRINPNINANTHSYITTGLEENKFGINMRDLEEVVKRTANLKNIKIMGIHFHIGSQITDLNAFKLLCLRANEIQSWFSSQSIILQHINVGGGLGVDYYQPDKNSIPDFAAYFSLFNTHLELRPKQTLHFEIGRAIVAQCGSLISKVLYVKKGMDTRFIILDAGMTELIRPALYQSYHQIENISSSLIREEKGERLQKEMKYDVVGPICESSDCFAKAVLLPETKRGDLISIRTAGAYGEVMSSQYNLREKVKALY
jgi:diaminopimelate decarboxylase